MVTEKKTEMQIALAKRAELLARYKKSRVLIVEDSAEARGVLRAMMSEAGVEKLDMVSSGQEAIDSLSARRYDIVLCDYNLGKGKDGQQVLEEARYSKFLSYSTIFIMITAETSVEMVMGALEYQPDSYLSKPFTAKALMARLGRALETKIEYKLIESQFERQNYTETISLCDQKIEDQDELPMRALRIKGECLMELKQYADAQNLFEKVLSDRDVPWAKIGLGKSLYFLKEFDVATTLFQELILEQPNVVESYDWLARIQKAQNLSRDAQDTLESAIARSPKAVLRQMELARTALSNHSYLIAEKAYRKSITLAGNSCYHSPDIYLQYVRSLLVKIDQSGSSICNEAYRDAKLFLGRLRKEFDNNTEVNFRANMLEALINFNRGKTAEADAMIESANRIYQNFEQRVRLKLSEEYISGLSLVGRIEDCQAYIHELQKTSDNPELANRLLRRVKDGKKRLYSENLNNEAMALYQVGQIMDAHIKFREAASKSGASAGVLLNAASVCLELAEREDLNKEDWQRECGTYLDRLSLLDRCDHRYQTYLSYQDRYQQL